MCKVWYLYVKNHHLVNPDGTLEFREWIIYDYLMSYAVGEILMDFSRSSSLVSSLLSQQVRLKTKATFYDS